MSLNFDLPRIAATDPAGQIAELRSYIWQLTEKLNYAFNYIDLDEAASSGQVLQTESGGYSGTGEGQVRDTVTSLQPFIGATYTAQVRTWSSGLKEAFLKTTTQTFEVAHQHGAHYDMPTAFAFTPLPPGFNGNNLLACIPSIAIENKTTSGDWGRDVIPYARLANDNQVRIELVSWSPLSGNNAVKGYLMLYLACK